MSVRIELENRGRVFTCLDTVTGKVLLNLSSDEAISSITVKMEGISRTRLIPPRREGERDRRAEVEIHRVLYAVQTVFPPAGVRENTDQNAQYTVRAGLYSYPFDIRIPINSACAAGPGQSQSLLNKLSFDNGRVDFARDAQSHLKGTLPPSLSGILGGDASIVYFLKVTVNRPAIFKTNLRAVDPFVFLPIEPPRGPVTKAETFGKRHHEFIAARGVTAPKKKGLFSSFRQAPSTPSLMTDTAPIRFSIEVRLPSPPIVVPNIPLPIRIIATKLESFREVIVVKSLQINLLINTHISAHGITRNDMGVISLLSVSNLRIRLGTEESSPNEEIEADPSLWSRVALPDTVAPTFTTCNISRAYELDVSVGLSYGSNDQRDVLVIRLPLQVYSGIQPPQKLIDAASRPPLPPRQSLKTPIGKRPASSTNTSPVSTPITPLAVRPHSSHGDMSPRLGEDNDAPPPTYEDAIAADVGPVDGPRRRYEQEKGYFQSVSDDMHH